MSKVKLLFLFALTLTFISRSIVNAQNDEYFYYHLTTQQGLSGNEVYSIFEDSRGLIWIGTQNGLNCYNGYEVKKLNRSGDPKAISESHIKCLFEDQSGIIWIGTIDNGVYSYDPVLDKFRSFCHNSIDPLSLSSNHVLTIYQDNNDIIWIGTRGGGLVRFDKKPETFYSYLINPNTPDSKRNIISAITEISPGKLWIGTHDGIYLFDTSNESFHSIDIIPNINEIYQQIFCFYEDPFGDVWFGTLRGFFKYNCKENKCIQIISKGKFNKDDLKDDAISSIQGSFGSGKDLLWLATKNGLVRYDVKNNDFTRILIDPNKYNSLSNDFINTLYLNRNGILWIGTAWSGIDRIDSRGNPFHHVQIKSENDDLYYSAGGFCMDEHGILWVSACTEGLFKFDQELNSIARYTFDKGFTIDANSPITNHVDYIYEDNDGILWIGVCGWGPVIFNRDEESILYLHSNLTKDELFRQERINSIIEDSYGNIWYGADGGVFIKEKDSKRSDPIRFLNREIVNQVCIYDIYESNEGDIYFGTLENGAYCLRKRERDSLIFSYHGKDESEPGLFKATVFDFYEDINGNLWAGSNKGLNKYDPQKKKFKFIYDTTGFFDEGISQVLGDQQGNLWLSSCNGGLLKFQPKTHRIKKYDANDGLPFENMVTRYWYQSSDGRIFIPGFLGDGNGFLLFHPDSVSDNKNIPRIIITDFRVGNKSFPVDSSISGIKHIELKHNQNFFSFAFAALDYTNPEKNQYAYYLEGLNEDWIYSGNQHYANYTSVPSGKYIFHVKGSNNDGYWNEDGIEVRISILPPPWKTWWAYTIYGIFLLGLIYAWRRYDLKRQRLKQELEIEHVEAEKLKELDSMKSRFFANISHEFRTPLTLILGPIEKLRTIVSKEAKRDLEMMQRNASRLQQLINQLLSLSKIESGYMKLQARELNLIMLVNNYVQSFESLAKQKQISLSYQYDEAEILVYVDQEKFEKILFNLLSNAFKFTPEGGKIKVEVEKKRSIVKISISDTGPGIPPDKLPHVFDRFYQADDSYTRDHEGTGIGLALTNELIELHHGEIAVESEVGKGATFTFSIPLGRDHLNNDDIMDINGISKVESLLSNVEIYDDRNSDNRIEEKFTTSQTDSPDLDSKPLLLIVEDNSDLRAYIRSYLDDAYSVIEAREGEEGLKTAIETIPNLVISDVMMPKMDGFELCAKMKSDERTSHIPVILLTARASEESKIQGLETGADDYLYKPFNHHELIIRVSNLIKQRNKLQEHFAKKLGLPGSMVMESAEFRVTSMDEKFITRASEIVDKHMSDGEFNIDTLGKLVGMSRSQLHRKLTALVNLSPTAFVRSLRLNRAASLILQKSGTISEIAFEVGFNNLSYFSRSFREQFGVLPSEYTDTQDKN